MTKEDIKELQNFDKYRGMSMVFLMKRYIKLMEPGVNYKNAGELRMLEDLIKMSFITSAYKSKIYDLD